MNARWVFHSPSGAWLVTATPEGSSVPAGAAAPDATMAGAAADLLAFLLGREPASPLEVSGDIALAEQFKLAFPGP